MYATPYAFPHEYMRLSLFSPLVNDQMNIKRHTDSITLIFITDKAARKMRVRHHVPQDGGGLEECEIMVIMIVVKIMILLTAKL